MGRTPELRRFHRLFVVILEHLGRRERGLRPGLSLGCYRACGGRVSEETILPGLEPIFLAQPPRLLGIQKELGVEPPILCMLTLVGVKGYTLWPDPARFFTRLHAVDRDILVVPEIMFENFNIDTPRVLKPIFHPVWQAMGFAGSINYDESGNRSEA